MNHAIRAIIVDDEELGRVNIRYALAAHPQWHIVAECHNADQAREVSTNSGIDVIFLDIQMPKESGLHLAKDLIKQAEPPLIIFVTAYNTYAVEAFDLYALDYLLKPFTNQRFAQTIERTAALLEQRQRSQYGLAMRSFIEANQQKKSGNTPQYWEKVIVRSVGTLETIPIENVLWINSAGNYVELHINSRVVLYRQTLNRMEEYLDPQQFIRVHRSTIVRINQLMQLIIVGDGSYQLNLPCGEKIMVSERYVQKVRSHMI